MRVLLDACVLFPTVMREVLLGVAAKGVFTPLWSDRILEEWARAVAAKLPERAEAARVEIALLRAKWPDAGVNVDVSITDSIHLPDPNDAHVLAAAICGNAETLVTLNLSDFPTRTLSGHDIIRRDPDGLLLEFFQENPELVLDTAETVRQKAEEFSGEPEEIRRLMKKVRLPRLGKALVLPYNYLS